MSSKFWDDDAMPGHLKAALLGRQGSGKTMTAVLLLLAYRLMRGLKGPLAFFDTETGSAYVRPMIEKFTGQKLLAKRARSIDEVVRFIQEAQQAGASGAVIDSVTHLWRGLCDGYLADVNERRRQYAQQARRPFEPLWRLEFQHWNAIKPRWQRFADLYLNEPIAIVACGRAGWEYEMADSDDKDGSGKAKKELQKVGVKMKAEGEFGYESSLLVEMDSEQDLGGDHTVIHRRATVLKDRFSVIDGQTHIFPSVSPSEFDKALREVEGFFKPHLALLASGGHVAVDTSPGKVEDSAIPNSGLRGDVAPISVAAARPVTAAAGEHEEAHTNATALATWEAFFRDAPLDDFTAASKAAMSKDFGGSPPRDVQLKWYGALASRYVAAAGSAIDLDVLAALQDEASADWQGQPLPKKMAQAFEEARTRLTPQKEPTAAAQPSGEFGPPPSEDGEEDADEVTDDGQGPLADTVDTWCARIGTAMTLEMVGELESAAVESLPAKYTGTVETAARYARQRLQSGRAPAAPIAPLPPTNPPPAPVTPIASRRATTRR